jgi:hypothetical protein
MCGLCGTFGVAEHWTDGAGATAASRKAERQHRTRVANEVLGLFGLRLNDWMNRYTLQSRPKLGYAGQGDYSRLPPAVFTTIEPEYRVPAVLERTTGRLAHDPVRASVFDPRYRILASTITGLSGVRLWAFVEFL